LGLASLLRPARPLPTRRSRVPLRRNPNSEAAIIAAGLARGHGTSIPHLGGANGKRSFGLVAGPSSAFRLLNFK
jgi:hypothetical protein